MNRRGSKYQTTHHRKDKDERFRDLPKSSWKKSTHGQVEVEAPSRHEWVGCPRHRTCQSSSVNMLLPDSWKAGHWCPAVGSLPQLCLEEDSIPSGLSENILAEPTWLWHWKVLPYPGSQFSHLQEERVGHSDSLVPSRIEFPAGRGGSWDPPLFCCSQDRKPSWTGH